MNNLLNNILLFSIIIVFTFIVLYFVSNNVFKNSNKENFNNTEAIQNLSAMYNNGNLSTNSIVSTSSSENVSISPGINTTIVNSENKIVSPSFCFDNTHCMNLSMFTQMSSLNSYVFGIGQKMYLPDSKNCSIFEIVDGLKNGIVVASTPPSSTYSATPFVSQNINNITFAGTTEKPGTGIVFNLPATHTVIWLRVQTGYLTVVSVYSGTTWLGNYTSSYYRYSNNFSPDGSTADSNLYYNWMPIALGIHYSTINVTPIFPTNSNFVISGVATSTNPWNHISDHAISYYYNINKTQIVSNPVILTGTWTAASTGWDSMITLPAGVISTLYVKIIPSTNDKLLYIIGNNDIGSQYSPNTYPKIYINIGNTGGSATSGSTINVERLTTTYVNPFSTHYNTRYGSKYMALRIPASLITTAVSSMTPTPLPVIQLTVTFDLTLDTAGFIIREMGTHDYVSTFISQ